MLSLALSSDATLLSAGGEAKLVQLWSLHHLMGEMDGTSQPDGAESAFFPPLSRVSLTLSLSLSLFPSLSHPRLHSRISQARTRERYGILSATIPR